VPFGRGALRREGKDLTVVAWGSTVYMAPDLAHQMEKDGVSVEVIDLRSIVPLDEELIYRSVRKTNRVMIAREDTLTVGFGAEVAARIAENCIGSLDGQVVRVAAKDSFVPSAPNLELAVLPSTATLRAGAERVLRY
jgi:2-oxoisovalerate dehydrogenase E1 component